VLQQRSQRYPSIDQPWASAASFAFTTEVVSLSHSTASGRAFHKREAKAWKFSVFSGNQEIHIERLREGLQHIVTLTEEGKQQLYDTITHDYPEVDQLDEWAPKSIFRFWPSLSRDTGSGILEIIAGAKAGNHVPLELDLEFANESHFCKWAYVVDLDKNTFEVFKGSETKQQASTIRFSDIGESDDTVPALLKSFPFPQLPATEKGFMRVLKAVMQEKGVYKAFLKSYMNAGDSSDDEVELSGEEAGEVKINEKEAVEEVDRGEGNGGMRNTGDAVGADK
jgi:hypothetical protein